MKTLSTENRNVFQRIFDEIKYLCKVATAGSKEARELERIKKTFAEVYKAKSEQKNNTDADGGVKYSISENFKKQLQSWDKKTTGFSFVLGNTSTALQRAGIPNKQIRMDATKISRIISDHSGMSIDTISQIPELLENPVVVLDSKSNSQARIVMGDLYDSNGKVVTTVLLLTPTSKKGNQLDIIKVSSAQGRSHIESLFLNEDGTSVNLRYVNKKRIQNWLNVNRLQLPLRSFNLDSNNSISNSTENVNNKSQEKFSLKAQSVDSEGNKLTEAQQEFYKNSVIRDAEGRIKPFYHGTARADRVGNYFNPERATSGPMAYFTDNQKIAENYSRDKADTSLAYESEYDSYETQFRVNVGGKSVSIVDYWKTLPIAEKNKIIATPAVIVSV